MIPPHSISQDLPSLRGSFSDRLSPCSMHTLLVTSSVSAIRLFKWWLFVSHPPSVTVCALDMLRYASHNCIIRVNFQDQTLCITETTATLLLFEPLPA
jgi:hypothetical protein